ncbi:MAG TPA: hypothetical protein VFN35_01630 [Ktedonobacteraceae bacterium]|nr:hypothetical protein [Ktedonobacteraceae bacterium]
MHLPKPSRRAFLLTGLGALFMLAILLFYEFFLSGAIGLFGAAAGTTVPWNIFRDPVYEYQLSYPSSWLNFTESDGSHLTLFNPLTRTTLNLLITTQDGSPEALLQQALGASGASQVNLAGLPAVTTLTPFLPEPSESNTINLPADGGPQQVKLVELPVANLVGTTNLYSMRLTQPTNLQGQITSDEDNDLRDFDTILHSFTLPEQIRSFAQPAESCDRICWADANWNYNSYDDAPSLYCTNPAWYFEDYSSKAYCGNKAGNLIGSYNAYGVQVPISQTGAWQPNFQCADFVSRSLTQDGLVPDLNNGGIYGKSPASPTLDGYNSYRATNGHVYHLWNVGIPKYPGLSDYLLDNQLATNIHTNAAQVSPGDVVFFIDQDGLYYHTMLITSQRDGYLVMDGHNAAQYHVVLKATDFNLDIYHLHA